MVAGHRQRLQMCCQECHKSPVKALMHPWEWPDRPLTCIHVDYAGPVKSKIILVMVDPLSKWINAYVVNSATSQATIGKLQLVFSTHGILEVLVSDNCTCFKNEEFAAFVHSNGIKHVMSALYHPASNRLGEKAIHILKTALMKNSNGDDIENQTSCFLFQYHITSHSTTGTTPADLLVSTSYINVVARV